MAHGELNFATRIYFSQFLEMYSSAMILRSYKYKWRRFGSGWLRFFLSKNGSLSLVALSEDCLENWRYVSQLSVCLTEIIVNHQTEEFSWFDQPSYVNKYQNQISNLIAGKYCKPFNLQVQRPDKMSHILIYGPNTCCIDKSCLVQTWAKRCRHPLAVSSKKQKMCWCSSTVVFQSLKVFFSPMSFLKLFDELIFLKSIEEWKWVQWRYNFFPSFCPFFSLRE